ncbi:MAG: PAS domain S-box protein, partial [Alphaproteobacteria bacterium]|nr:PAS domain S-box protein [Alphaproteobacteria bacterium]
MVDEETLAKWETWRKRTRTHLDLAERAAGIGYWRFDLRDNSYFWSPGMYRLLGEDPNSRKPDMEYLFERMTPQSREIIQNALATAIKTRSPFAYRTYSSPHIDTPVAVVDTQGEVEVDESGRTIILFGVCKDVTEQVRVEEERERVEAMYRLMTEESGDIVILYDTHSNMIFSSQALERLTGRSADEIRNGGYKNFIHPEDTDEANKMIVRPLDAGIVAATWRIQHAKGHYVWLETTIRTVYDPETRQPKNVISVSRDVTARVEAERERRKAYELFQIMTTEASDMIILYDARAKVLFASDALARVLGRKPHEIEGRKWVDDLAHPDDRGFLRELEMPPKQGETLTVSYRMRHGAGHYVWLEVATRGRYDENGKTIGLLSVARDITARKEQELAIKAAQERAEAANQAKSRFLANMSHELRTPLNAIIGFADLMRMETFGKLGNPRYEDYATLIYDSGGLLLDLITDMLDMAKIEAGKLELNMERVDVAGTIEDAVRLVRDRAVTGDVALIVETAETPSLVADRRAMKQIVLNLVTNAIKFTPPGGEVRIGVAQLGDAIQITVADTGIGIPESEIGRLGKPFEQVCGDPMLAKSGTGLGLALVKALAEKHGGGMTIASAEGVGTTVTVTLALDSRAIAAQASFGARFASTS